MRITKRFNGNITDDKRKVLVDLFGSDVKIQTTATYFRIIIGDDTYKDNKDQWQITSELLDKLESELRTSKTQPYSNAVKSEIARQDRQVKRVQEKLDDVVAYLGDHFKTFVLGKTTWRTENGDITEYPSKD